MDRHVLQLALQQKERRAVGPALFQVSMYYYVIHM